MDVAFSVPTGNFGNVFAGRVAAHMGLPVSQFIVGSNSNDILTRYFETGTMTMEGVVPTLSPSMDIQISSNFERLLFGALGNNGEAVAQLLEQLKQNLTYSVPDTAHADILRYFIGHRLDDAGIKRVIRDIYVETGHLIDPHTAVGVHAARASQVNPTIPLLIMATAHPAKFPAAVEAATGIQPALPPSLKDLFSRTERFTTLDPNLDAIKTFVRENARI